MAAPPRRTLIADAIITTLARTGSRGLTHRAVDEAAGLSPGSTSYYLRTRSSLLVAAVERLAELDAAEVPRLDGAPAGEGFARLLDDLLTTGRERLLARYELSLEAVRRPELREALVAGTVRIRDLLAEHLASVGVARPSERAQDLLALLDGLLFAEVTATHGPRRSSRELQQTLEWFVASALSSP